MVNIADLIDTGNISSRGVSDLGHTCDSYRHGSLAFGHLQRLQPWKRILLALLFICWSVSTALATTYYAAVNGSSGNSGLSASAPWPLAHALARAGSGNTIIVLPGVYTGNLEVTTPYLTIRSQVKWGATLANLPYGLACGYSGDATGTVVDGFKIVNSRGPGIQFRNSNCVARNCWISGSGAGHPNANGSGITTPPVDNTLIENNLLEYNGWQAVYDHGVYIAGGKNCIVRNNVCRYNAASGIQVYANGGVPTNARVYNNLCYGNTNWGIVCGTVGNPIYIHNNTVVGAPGGAAIGAGQSTTLMLTNNILLAGRTVFDIWSGKAVGDYNLLNRSEMAQAHGLVSSANNFVDPARGRYWLASGSPARNAALSTVFGPTDFFGTSQSAVNDMGAFPYNSAYASDTRVLDPSPSDGADYWQILGNPGGSTGGGSTADGLSFQASSGTLTAPFVVTNGSVCQFVDTENANGGQAVYKFTITNAGVYLVSAVVNAANTSQNSLYVTIDDAISEPYMVWDIPVTSGFESRTVSWRGNGTWDANAFIPKAFNLSAGTHSLIIGGRERNTLLQSIQIVPANLTAPSAAPVLRKVSTP